MPTTLHTTTQGGGGQEECPIWTPKTPKTKQREGLNQIEFVYA
jgi:hypothetical protein